MSKNLKIISNCDCHNSNEITEKELHNRLEESISEFFLYIRDHLSFQEDGMNIEYKLKIDLQIECETGDAFSINGINEKNNQKCQ